ncbi:shikimate kinase [Persicirhabdus sediminis]|uniref:Shikimate kinase n=1 Tax=Persicirhabdus sediminis TaxID=454144 RepID=A0A8J7MDR1_9BACT|nr:shikimate kinase [Persicirhabdus sediminis]MBK1790648.1 shikimate kinase [Persicirhabdus sediminis]
MNEDQTNPMRKNIILIGFMGCGKSTIGIKLSKSLNYTMIDTDHYIESREKLTIPEIFEARGQEAFRDMETKLLRELVANKTTCHIIATGGGIISRPENIDLLRQLGFVVWLNARPEIILERTSRNQNRPLLQVDDPLSVIKKLLKERKPLYKSAAHVKISTSDLSQRELTLGISESARYHFGHH